MKEDKPGCQLVLVVDEDPDIRAVLAELLEMEGYEVSTVSSGAEAFQIIGRVPRPCLVLLDVLMSGTDGWSVLRVLRMHERGVVPIVIVTAGIFSHEIVERAFASGASGILRKPFDLNQLLKTLRTFCPSSGAAGGSEAPRPTEA